MSVSTTNNGSMGREFLRFAVPSVAGMVVSSLYTIVDGIFVGRGVGELALGAVNIVFPFIMFQIAVTMLIAIGGANLFSIYRGRRRPMLACNVFAQSMAVLGVLTVLINAVVLLFGRQVCVMLGADSQLLPYAQVYIRWIAVFGLAQMPAMAIGIFIRNDNSPNLEMIGTLSGAVINIVLDYLFIMVWGWGIAGAAIATGIGQIACLCIYLLHFLTGRGILRFAKPMMIAHDLKKIAYNGLSSFLMEFSQSAVALSFNIVLIARLGASGVSAYSIVMYICSIFNMVLIGVVQGAQPIMSYNHGSGHSENVRKIYRLGVGSNLVLSVLFYLVCLAFGARLAGLFSSGNAELTSSAVKMMTVYFVGFFPVGVSLMNILYFQATEREFQSSLVSFLRCIGFVQLFLILLPGMIGEYGIYLAFFCGELCNCAVSFLMFRVKELPFGSLAKNKAALGSR